MVKGGADRVEELTSSQDVIMHTEDSNSAGDKRESHFVIGEYLSLIYR